MTRELLPTDYQHTRVVGYSIIHSAWPYLYAAISNPAAWELLWYTGGSIDNWANTDFAGWTYNGPDFTNTGGLINPIGGNTNPTVGAGAVDRVILCVSGMAIVPMNDFPPGGYTKDVSAWIGFINTAVANLRSKYPATRMILLQGPVAATNFAACNGFQDATYNPNSPYENRQTYHSLPVYSAITHATKANVRRGLQPTLSSCARLTDWAGHMDAQGAQELGESMATYYAANL